jgi:ornithine cyclodeaminase/alanine dehydrogenase-like protein (mu-crystallin family)
LLRNPHAFAHEPANISIFDSSGLAIQDLAAAHAAFLCVTQGDAAKTS